MRKKIFLTLAALFLAVLPGYAQQGAGKELVIIRDYDDCWHLDLALWHAIQLKRGGAQVQVILQDEAVLAALYYPLPPQTFDEENVPDDLWREQEQPNRELHVGTSGKRPRGDVWTVKEKLKFSGKLLTPSDRTASTMVDFRALKIPYVVSAFSAKLLGVYDQLKAKGEPLSPDPDKPVDISPLVKAGYRVSIF